MVTHHEAQGLPPTSTAASVRALVEELVQMSGVELAMTWDGVLGVVWAAVWAALASTA